MQTECYGSDTLYYLYTQLFLEVCCFRYTCNVGSVVTDCDTKSTIESVWLYARAYKQLANWMSSRNLFPSTAAKNGLVCIVIAELSAQQLHNLFNRP